VVVFILRTAGFGQAWSQSGRGKWRGWLVGQRATGWVEASVRPDWVVRWCFQSCVSSFCLSVRIPARCIHNHPVRIPARCIRNHPLRTLARCIHNHLVRIPARCIHNHPVRTPARCIHNHLVRIPAQGSYRRCQYYGCIVCSNNPANVCTTSM
jgi:hypothetical protein